MKDTCALSRTVPARKALGIGKMRWIDYRYMTAAKALTQNMERQHARSPAEGQQVRRGQGSLELGHQHEHRERRHGAGAPGTPPAAAGLRSGRRRPGIITVRAHGGVVLAPGHTAAHQPPGLQEIMLS